MIRQQEERLSKERHTNTNARTQAHTCENTQKVSAASCCWCNVSLQCACKFSELWPSFDSIIIRQPLCTVVGRRPQHAASKLASLVLSSVRSCRSSICPDRLSTAWLVSLVAFSCRMVSKWKGPSVVFEAVDVPCPGPIHFTHIITDYVYDFCPVMLSILLSILVRMAASLFVLVR